MHFSGRISLGFRLSPYLHHILLSTFCDGCFILCENESFISRRSFYSFFFIYILILSSAFLIYHFFIDYMFLLSPWLERGIFCMVLTTCCVFNLILSSAFLISHLFIDYVFLLSPWLKRIIFFMVLTYCCVLNRLFLYKFHEIITSTFMF